ncbi:MAG TPA: AtpZ/AtpI family protein [Planctomycetota bacterium]|nr:AtpZ/AtpI family protein [Planctomycetota bacterium]
MPSTTPERGGQGPAPYLKYAGLGVQFALTFLVFGAIGWWLDTKLGTAPWLMLIGIALGAAGAFWSLVRSVPPAGGSRAHGHEPKTRDRR